MDQQNRKAVIFDFGGVIFKTSAAAMYRDIFAAAGRPPQDADYFLKTIFTEQDRSSANSGNMTDVTRRLAERHPDWADYIHAFDADRDFIRQVRNVIPGMEDTLKEIKGRGYEIYGLTNWAADTFATLRTAYPALTGLFNKIMVSGEIGIKKPDEEIFRLAQREFGNIDPAHIFYFDDKAGNVQAARAAAGWQAIVFEDAQTVRDALKL